VNPDRKKAIDAARRALMALLASVGADPAPELAAVSVLVHDVTRQIRSIESILIAAEGGAS
jgi:hypothetical protein